MEDVIRTAELDMSSTAKTATLFDTLSTDTLAIIAKEIDEGRFLEIGDDEAPKMPDKWWRARFLAMLFAENSPFRAAAATLVSTIAVDWLSPQLYIGDERRTLYMGPEMFQGEAKEMELGRIVFSACGPYLRRIRLVYVPKDDENAKGFVEEFKSHVFQYCRNVKVISFSGYGAPLKKWGAATSFFREYAANLREIDWDGDEDETGFLDLRQCTNVRRLKSRKLNTATLVSLLEASGPTLENLDISLTPAGDSVEIVETIRNHCKNLTVIIIENLEDVIDTVGQECYSSLIRGYGSQLKNATMNGLSNTYLVEVLTHVRTSSLPWIG